MDDWQQCPFVEIDPQEPCYGGLDLSSKQDLTALVLYWPCNHALWCRFFLPEDHLEERAGRNISQYRRWVESGHLILTPGPVVDYAFVRREACDAYEIWNIIDIGYDPHNAQQLATELAEEDDIEMVEFNQGFGAMNEPCQTLEGLVLSHVLGHNGNPALQWQASNALVRKNADGLIKIDKKKATEKVDGMVATAMAIGRSLDPDADDGGDVGLYSLE